MVGDFVRFMGRNFCKVGFQILLLGTNFPGSQASFCPVFHILALLYHSTIPLMFPVNRPCKHFMQEKFEGWYAAEVEKKLAPDCPT